MRALHSSQLLNHREPQTIFQNDPTAVPATTTTSEYWWVQSTSLCFWLMCLKLPLSSHSHSTVFTNRLRQYLSDSDACPPPLTPLDRHTQLIPFASARCFKYWFMCRSRNMMEYASVLHMFLPLNSPIPVGCRPPRNTPSKQCCKSFPSNAIALWLLTYEICRSAQCDVAATGMTVVSPSVALENFG